MSLSKRRRGVLGPSADYYRQKINGSATKVEKRYANSTKRRLYVTSQFWARFCSIIEVDEKEALTCGNDDDNLITSKKAQTYEAYLEFILNMGGVRCVGSLQTEWQYLRMLHRSRNEERDIGPVISQHMRNYLPDLNKKFELQAKSRDKAEMSVTDLWFVLRHLWAYDTEQYTAERERVQMAFMLQLAGFTASRPGAIIESSCARGSNRALRYRHCELKLVDNPNPASNGRKYLWVLHIDLVYLKGDIESRNPQRFTIHEDDNPIFCPIISFLSLAFADKAFDVSELQEPSDLLKINVTRPLQCQKITWKDSILDTPVLRGATDFQVSQDRAWTYGSFQPKLRKLGRATGFQENVSIYCERRETGNLLNAINEHERQQILRHSKSQTFDRNYLSQHVRRDVQNIFLGLPENVAVKTAAQMRTNMDPRAPYKLTWEQRKLIQKDPEILRLTEDRDRLAEKLKSEYGVIKDGQGTNTHFEYKEACRALQKERKFQDFMKTKELRNEYFRSIHSITLRQQLSASGTNSNLEEQEILQQVHTFPERSRIANTYFFRPKSESIEEENFFDNRRIQIIKDLTALCSLHEIRRRGNFTTRNLPSKETLSEDDSIDCVSPDLYPMIIEGTVCLFCLGNVNLSRNDRERKFKRLDSFRRHVQKLHQANLDENSEIPCPHPACTAIFDNYIKFQNHAAHIHKVFH